MRNGGRGLLPFPQDVVDQHAFYAQKKAKHRAEKDDMRARKRFIEVQEAGPSTIDDNDERWMDMFLSEPLESSELDYDFSN
jgi:hypothetical protein